MARTTKLFRYRRSQAVRLPAEFRFEGHEVLIWRDPKTGDVILSRRPDSWDSFLALIDEGGIPDDFMAERGDQRPQKRRVFQ